MSEAQPCLLYGAQDAQGRRWLVDARIRLPADAQNIQEFVLSSDQVAWAKLRLRVEALRGEAVMIHIGDDYSAMPASSVHLDAPVDDQSEHT